MVKDVNEACRLIKICNVSVILILNLVTSIIFQEGVQSNTKVLMKAGCKW